MARKKGIFGFGWGTILIVGGLAGSAAAWHFHPPFRRAICNIGPIGTHFPLCKQEPGYVASEKDLPEGYDGSNPAPELNTLMQMATSGSGALGTATPPNSGFVRSYAGRRIGRRLPKLKHSR